METEKCISSVELDIVTFKSALKEVECYSYLVDRSEQDPRIHTFGHNDMVDTWRELRSKYPNNFGFPTA